MSECKKKICIIQKSKKILWTMLLFLCMNQINAEGDNLPLVTIGKASSPPVLDGKLDDMCWEHCIEINNFIKYRCRGDFSAEPTAIKITYDDGFLYMGVKCPDKHLNPVLNQLHKFKAEYDMKSKDSLNIFKDDNIELFLAPDERASEKYYHICVNSLGAVYDSFGAFGAEKWNSGLVAKSVRDEKAWYLEIAIPLRKLSEMKIIPSKTVWKANFCRNIKSITETSSWSPANASGFHDPAIFGTMRFITTVPGMSNVTTPVMESGKHEFSAEILNQEGPNTVTLNLNALFDGKETVSFGDLVKMNGKQKHKLTVRYDVNSSNHAVFWEAIPNKDVTATILKSCGMTLSPDTEYKFRALVKTELTRSGSQVPYNFFFVKTDRYYSLNAKAPMKSNGWQQVYGTFKTGKETNSVELWIVKWAKHNIQGRLGIDNLSLIDAKTGMELVGNGEFEKGTAGWPILRELGEGYGYNAEKLSANYSLSVNDNIYYRSPEFATVLGKTNLSISSGFVNFGDKGLYQVEKLAIAVGTTERLNLVVRSIHAENTQPFFFEFEMPYYCRLTDMSHRKASIIPLTIKEQEIVKDKKVLRRYLLTFDSNAVSRLDDDRFAVTIPLCIDAIGPWSQNLGGEIRYRAWFDEKQKEQNYHSLQLSILPPLAGKQPKNLPLTIWEYPTSQSLVTLGSNEQEKFIRKQAMAGYNLAACGGQTALVPEYRKHHIRSFALLPSITITAPAFPFVREFLEKYPDAAACHTDGKSANAIDPAYLLSVECKFLPYIKKVMEIYCKYYPDGLNWDYEFSFMEKKRAQIGYSRRNLELFKKMAKIPPSEILDANSIQQKYAEQWEDFRCRQVADTVKIYHDIIRGINPTCRLSFYSGYPPQSAFQYGCNWKYVSPHIDLAMCGYGGNNTAMLQSIKQDFFNAGVILISYPNQSSLECLLGRLLTEAGSYLSYVWFVVDGQFFLASSRMAAVASDFEDFFLNLKDSRKDSLVCGDDNNARNDIRVLERKNERLLFIFNNGGNQKTVNFRNLQLSKGHIGIDYDTKMVFKRPDKITVVVKPWRVKVIYVTREKDSESIPVLCSSIPAQYPILRWQDSDSAIKKYQLQYSLQSNFSAAVTISDIADNHVQIGTPLTAGKFFWRVRNINAINGKVGSWSAMQTFNVTGCAPLTDYKRPVDYRQDCFGKLGFWTTVSWGCGAVSLLSQDCQVKKSGKYSLKCENMLPASHSFWTTFYRPGGGSKLPYIKPGEKYRLSAWVKTSGSAEAGIQINLLNSDGTKYKSAKSDVVKTTADWREVACIINTGKECAMEFRFNVDEEGIGWCSNMKLEKL